MSFATSATSLANWLTADPRAAADRLDALLCERSLADFVRSAWPILEPGTAYLHNWHIDCICEHLEAVTKGEIRRLLINMPPRYMKPVYNGSMILLSNGRRKNLEDIQVGDDVVTHEGRPGRVTAVHEQGDLPVLKITTDTGRSVIAAHDHPFLTPTGWVEAGKLTVGDTLALVVPGPITPGPRQCEEFRLAGYFVGDGCCVESPAKHNTPNIQSHITCFDEEQGRDIDRCVAAMGFVRKESTVKGRYNVSGGVRDWLKSTGLAGTNSKTKRVPGFVFEASAEQIGHFVGAYFACDGTMSRKSADRRALTISIASINRPLLCDVQHLLLRLGIRCRVRTKNVACNAFTKAPHVSYMLELSTQDDTSKFVDRVPVPGAKSEKLRAWGVRRTGFDNVRIGDRIVAIEDAGVKPCRCLTVEGDHSFLAEDLAVHNSIAVSVCWPAWEWIGNSEQRWVFSSYSGSLSSKHSVDRRTLIRSDWYQRNWGDRYQLSGDQDVKTEFQNTRRGVMVATSVGATATGKGGNRLVVDDPHNPKQADSDVEREAAVEWFGQTFFSRLDDKRAGSIVVVMQRLHERDLSAKCIEQGYTHLCLPAVAERRIVVPMRGGAEVVREQGDLLWPGREGPKEIAEAEIALTPYGFAGQYQQRPSPKGGGFFKYDWFPIVAASPVAASRVRYWDTAGTEGGGDYTVGTRIAMTPDRRFYVEDVVRGQWSPGRRNQEMRAVAEKDGRSVAIWMEQEAGVGGKDRTAETIRTLAGFAVHAEPATGSKESRADGLASQAEAGNVKLVKGDWNHAFTKELTSFPTGAHDDQVDSASGAFNKLAAARQAAPPAIEGGPGFGSLHDRR